MYFFRYKLRNYTDLIKVYGQDDVEMAHIFLPRTDHMVLQNILILVGMIPIARYIGRVKHVTLYRNRMCNDI